MQQGYIGEASKPYYEYVDGYIPQSVNSEDDDSE